MKYETSAANSFGAGIELIGKYFRGKVILSATRKNMTTEAGTFPRKGNYVQHEPINYSLIENDNSYYQTDDL